MSRPRVSAVAVQRFAREFYEHEESTFSGNPGFGSVGFGHCDPADLDSGKRLGRAAVRRKLGRQTLEGLR